MKISLPFALRRWCLSVAFVSISASQVSQLTQAAVLNDYIDIQIYTDFAHNLGAFKAGNTNTMIVYKDGKKTPFTIPVMPNFGSASGTGSYNLISHNMVVTAAHMGPMADNFSRRVLGSASSSIGYNGVYRNWNGLFGFDKFGNDYAIQRTNKMVTDASITPVCTDIDYILRNEGHMVYRLGGGVMYVRDANGNDIYQSYGYETLTGGISHTKMTSIDLVWPRRKHGFIITGGFSNGSITSNNPLPYVAKPGDSGSPGFIWNEKTNQYEYVGSVSGSTDSVSTYHASARYTTSVMSAVTAKPELSDTDGTIVWDSCVKVGLDVEAAEDMIYLSASSPNSLGLEYSADGQKIINVRLNESDPDNLAAYFYAGTITSGGISSEHAGINQDFHGATWKDINLERVIWYKDGTNMMDASYENLFFTQDVVYEAKRNDYDIIINGQVDTGIGTVTFDKGIMDHATYSLRAGDAGGTLDTSGMIINQGVTVVTELTGNADEWRAIGEGKLIIAGNGNNYIGLNIGNNLDVSLERQGGYAVYNALINTGARISLSDSGQIANNLTFGSQGGTLELNGQSIKWESTGMKSQSHENFAITMLTEDAVIANTTSGTISNVIISVADNDRLLGSFQDGNGGSLRVIFDRAEKTIWNSLQTSLLGNDSAIVVNQGHLELLGTKTKHANMFTSSLADNNKESFTYYDDDWHYANVQGNVEVKSGAVFELGSHARLDGNVTVESGGTFRLNSGVHYQYEFIDGTPIVTYDSKSGEYKISGMDMSSSEGRQFYGVYGDITLQNAARMELNMTSWTGDLNGGNLGLGAHIGGHLTLGEGSFVDIKLNRLDTFSSAGGISLGDHSLTIGKNSTLDIQFAGMANKGKYLILSSNSILGDINDFILAGTYHANDGTRQDASLIMEGNNIYLNIANDIANLSWNNIDSGTWSMSSVDNGLWGGSTDGDNAFYKFDNVCFMSETDVVNNVVIEGSVVPSEISIEGGRYRFSSSADTAGSIDGASSFSITGGSVEIATNNTYSGGIVVRNEIEGETTFLTLSEDNAGGSGALNIQQGGHVSVTANQSLSSVLVDVDGILTLTQGIRMVDPNNTPNHSEIAGTIRVVSNGSTNLTYTDIANSTWSDSGKLIFDNTTYKGALNTGAHHVELINGSIFRDTTAVTWSQQSGKVLSLSSDAINSSVANIDYGNNRFVINGGGEVTLGAGITTKSGELLVGNGVLNIENGATINASNLGGVDSNSSTAVVNQYGGTVNLTRAGSGSGGGNGLRIQNYNGNGTYNMIGGTLNVLNSCIDMGAWHNNNASLFNQSGGIVNTKELYFTNTKGKYTLEGGSLHLGERGINNKVDTVILMNLGDGSLGGFSSWVGSDKVTMNLGYGATSDKSTTTTINTSKYDTAQAVYTAESIDITINGTIVDSTELRGGLSVQGSGRLILKGNNTYSGGTSVKSGRLVLGHANAAGSGLVSLDRNSILQVGIDSALTANISTLEMAVGSAINVNLVENEGVISNSQLIISDGMSISGVATLNICMSNTDQFKGASLDEILLNTSIFTIQNGNITLNNQTFSFDLDLDEINVYLANNIKINLEYDEISVMRFNENNFNYKAVASLTENGEGRISLQAIPEPSTATLGLIGLSMLLLRRRRRMEHDAS